jgi:putative spermidine/putrescine transport system permease protein
MLLALPRHLLRLTGILAVVAILGFLVLPAIVVTLAAFNSRSILSFPPETWSLRWFAKALAYEDFQAGFRNGLIVTAWASTIALAVGAAFAFALDRYRFPFVLRSVYVSLRNLDPRLELAAASLGAPPARVLATVTLPLLLPGLVSGWLFAAILSFNEFTASLFVTAQRTQTLPVAMYNYVREYADPSMAALSVMYIVATALLLTFANAFLGLGKVLNVEHAR